MKAEIGFLKYSKDFHNVGAKINKECWVDIALDNNTYWYNTTMQFWSLSNSVVIVWMLMLKWNTNKNRNTRILQSTYTVITVWNFLSRSSS